MKTKILLTIIVMVIILGGSSLVFAQQYTPMEAIPGSGGVENISTFPSYIQAIYKFAIWSVGISALLMISIGGFMYFTAAGNTSKLESAKKVISDALFGLIAVMVASLILYKINPDLININLDSFNNLNQSGAQGINPGGGSPSGVNVENGQNVDENNQAQTDNGDLIRDADGNILEPQPIR